LLFLDQITVFLVGSPL
jgi:hypothetical protein